MKKNFLKSLSVLALASDLGENDGITNKTGRSSVIWTAVPAAPLLVIIIKEE